MVARKQPYEGLELRGLTVLVREICVEKSRNLIDDREVDRWMDAWIDRQFRENEKSRFIQYRPCQQNCWYTDPVG